VAATIARRHGATERARGALSPACLRVIIAVLLTIPLAGCTGDAAPVETNVIDPGFITGVVTDVAMVPLAGVNVSVDGTTLSALTDAAGSFAFELLPGEYVVLAQHADHRPGALRASVISHQRAPLAFQLVAIPKIVPRVEVSEASGYLACSALLLRSGERTPVPCGGEDPNDRPSVEFGLTSRDGLESAVLEVVWDAGSQAARKLRVEASSRGSDGSVALGAVEGTSPLALPIPGRLVAGDTLVLTVSPAGSFLDEEAGSDAGLVFQQAFTAYASLFYHEPAPGGYSALVG